MIPTVARFWQFVGSEAQPDAVLDDVVDHRHVVPRVEVVDQLGAFVADESAVLELRVTCHRDATVADADRTGPGTGRVVTMTVLVTGGAGYIGSHTVRALRRAGREVVVLDSLELGRADAVIDAPLVVGNISDNELVGSVIRDHHVTQVVHFAAYKAVGESMEQPTKYWRNNVAGSVELLDTCLANGIDQVVFSSSCSVYGTPPEVPVTEAAPIAPESVYAETKADIERIMRWYGVTNGLRAVSLRYFNAAGASFDGRIGEDWTYSINLIPLVMKAILLGDRRLSVFGDDYDTPDGTCIRDYIHVDDLADAHVRSLDHLAAGGPTVEVNVGTGVGSSVLDVIRAAERVSGRPVPYDVVDRRPGDPVSTYADPTFRCRHARLERPLRPRRGDHHRLELAPVANRRLMPRRDDAGIEVRSRHRTDCVGLNSP